MDTCLTVTHDTSHSSLRKLPELQRVPGDAWSLQGLADRVACSNGIE
jgi:hypothetical protein